MKRILVCLFSVIFACSCSPNKSTDESDLTRDERTESTDTIKEIVISDYLQSILDKANVMYQLPIDIDTNFVKKIDFENKDSLQALTYENVRYLSVNLMQNEPTEYATYNLNSFFMIDSLKSVGKYEEYVENLDLGMMKHSNAYGEGLIDINTSQQILLWSLNYATYEACPYSHGSIVFGTLLTNYEVANTIVLAEISGGGDPPYWGHTHISSRIVDGRIRTDILDRSGEYDEITQKDLIEVTKSDYEVSITTGGLESIDN